ncbi:MAG: hypothetical protein BWY57_03144 [Betaproteobacteria bacterium ADurb.Bin341]|nr:MAG: hypothetical protein BWY57_03144 [Betaproteobacteria bacterium ADurb.Bin341]
MFYAKSTGGFYDAAIHGDAIPVDAVEITIEEHAALLEGQSNGKRIIADAEGRPVLADLPAPTLDELKASKNAEINSARAAANTSTFDHGGKTFSCDQLSRGDIDGVNGEVALTGALPQGFSGAWKAVDNTFLPIADVAAWTAFYRAMVAQGAANFMHAQQLKTQLAAATTAEEVDAIAW